MYIYTYIYIYICIYIYIFTYCKYTIFARKLKIFLQLLQVYKMFQARIQIDSVIFNFEYFWDGKINYKRDILAKF